MNDTLTRQLGSFAIVTSSKRIFLSDYVLSGIPFYRSKEIIEKALKQNISTELFITYKRFEEIKMQFGVPVAGDILISAVGERAGIPYVVKKSDGDFYFKDGNLIWIKDFKDHASADYLCYYFKSNNGKKQLESTMIGSAQKALTIVGLKQIELLLPRLPDQESIAEVLSSLDDKIDLLHRQNKTLEEVAETLFRQWFVEEGENLEVGKLGEIIELFDNKRIPLSSTERDKLKIGNLYPYYGAATIMDYINKYIFDDDYLLLGEDGTVQDEDGYPILQRAIGKCWVNNHTHVIKGKKGYSNNFLEILLKHINISHLVTGAVQPKINQANLKELDIPKPAIEKVEKFSLIIDPLYNKKHFNLQQIKQLETIRDTLLPKLMSGAVRVMN